MIQTENYKRELIFIFFAQKRIILWTTVLVLLASVLIAFFYPPVYNASGSILVRSKKIEKSPEALEDIERKSFPVAKEDLFSEVEILVSPDVIGRTISLLKSKKQFPETGKSLVDDVYSIQRNLKTNVIPASNVVEVTLSGKDPNDATVILDALMAQYIVYRTEVYNPSQAEGFFAQQAANFKDNLENREDEMVDLVAKTGIADPAKEIENNIILKKNMEEQLNTLRLDAIKKRHYIEYLEKALKNRDLQFFSFMRERTIQDLSLKLLDLDTERTGVLRIYHPSSDRVKAIDEQIESAYASLKKEVQVFKDNEANELKIIQSAIKDIEARLLDMADRNVNLKRQLVEGDRISREAELLEYSYETFFKRREEAKINTVALAANLYTISILSKAFPSDGPVFPKKSIIPFGLVVGFITGLSLGFLNEYFSHTFRKPNDLYRYAELPLLFSIPEAGEGKARATAKAYGAFIAAVFVAAGAVYMLGRPGVAAYSLPEAEAGGRPAAQAASAISPHDMVEAPDMAASQPAPEVETPQLALLDTARPELEKTHQPALLEKEARPVVAALPAPRQDTRAMAMEALKTSEVYGEGDGYYLRFNSHANRHLAFRENERLRNMGLKSFVTSINANNAGTVYRVFVGPFESENDALAARSEGRGALAN